MPDNAIGGVSGTTNPYGMHTYSPSANDKNTLDISDYFALLAAQMANQDYTNPMDNSEMMAQMVQMAMLQSVDTMTEATNNATIVSTQTYAAGLTGQEVTVAVTEENSYGMEDAVGVKYGKVVSVNLTVTPPTIRIEGDDKDYPLSYIVGMGQVEDPFKKPENPDEGEAGGEDSGTEGPGSEES